MKQLLGGTIQTKKLFVWLGYIGLMCLTCSAYAIGGGGGGSSITLGTMASSITSTFTSITKMVTAGSYVVGLAFSITAIVKFKQHKDNPSQIPIGTPVSLVFIAAALLFLPSILNVAGYTMFGEGGATVAGPTGSVFTSP